MKKLLYILLLYPAVLCAQPYTNGQHNNIAIANGNPRGNRRPHL